LGAGLELSRRALDAGSLEELYFLLTNDMRALIEFDRSHLLIHLGGVSRGAATGNQPLLEKKSKFYEPLDTLALKLRGLTKPLFLAGQTDLEKLTPDILAPEVKEAVLDFMDFSGATGIVIAPLKSDNEILGHAAYEFLDDRTPDQVGMVAFLNCAAFFGAALARSWALSRHPTLRPLTESRSWIRRWLPDQTMPRLRLYAIIAGITLLVLFALPIPFNVGGEAEVLPLHRFVAFCQTEGIVQDIRVTEGVKVEKGQVIAALDPTEPMHKITMAERQVQLLRNEADMLHRASIEDISKLSESQLTAWKLKRAQAELDYLKWQLRFLDIKAPATGVVVTKQVETLVGKKFRAGEPFCEIAAPDDLCTDILVPEDRMAFIQIGQRAFLALDSNPLADYPLRVTEIAPKTEVIPHTGNICRVRGIFTGELPRFSVGQKGTGSISTGTRSLWFIMKQRIGVRINEFFRYLW